MPARRETDLYAPIKAFLEAQGYAVKGEVEGCDVVAVRGAEAPLVVELKRSFSLDLVLQGVARQKLTDKVYLAVADEGARGSTLRRRRREVARLCRLLGLGLLVVGGEPAVVEPRLDPGPYRPRQTPRRRERLLKEFAQRAGDPNRGGAARRGIVTAYRQDALRCAALLDRAGPMPLAALRARSGVGRAARILQRDVYGWFDRPARGVYALSPVGRVALGTYADAVAALSPETREHSETTCALP